MVWRLDNLAPLHRTVAVSLAAACVAIRAGTALATVVLSGTITYSGSMGPASATRQILMELGNNPTFHHHAKVSETSVPASPDTFILTAPAAGNYYLVFALDANGDGQPSVGEPYQIFNHRSTFPADPIAVPQSNVALDLDDTFLLSGIAGSVRYEGTLGQVSAAQPLIVAGFVDPELTVLAGGTAVTANPGTYNFITMDNNTYYLLAFVDLNNNEALDAGEPFEIFQSKASPPGTAVQASPHQVAVDFDFGDENLAGAASPTPTPTTMASTPAPTDTPFPLVCVGDCSGDRRVAVNEVIVLVNIILGNAQPSACPHGIPSGRSVNVSFIIQAVNNTLNGCPAT